MMSVEPRTCGPPCVLRLALTVLRALERDGLCMGSSSVACSLILRALALQPAGVAQTTSWHCKKRVLPCVARLRIRCHLRGLRDSFRARRDEAQSAGAVTL